jgi:pterin-4a-carbinolamine dehydratase
MTSIRRTFSTDNNSRAKDRANLRATEHPKRLEERKQVRREVEQILKNPRKQVSQDDLKSTLNTINGWSITPRGISKSYSFESYHLLSGFLKSVLTLSQKVDHSPEIHAKGNDVTISWITHEALDGKNVVTHMDVQLAKSTDVRHARALGWSTLSR